MAEPSPPDHVTTTTRLTREMHQRVKDASVADHRSFNAEVVALLEVALAHRDAEMAQR